MKNDRDTDSDVVPSQPPRDAAPRNLGGRPSNAQREQERQRLIQEIAENPESFRLEVAAHNLKRIREGKIPPAVLAQLSTSFNNLTSSSPSVPRPVGEAEELSLTRAEFDALVAQREKLTQLLLDAPKGAAIVQPIDAPLCARCHGPLGSSADAALEASPTPAPPPGPEIPRQPNLELVPRTVREIAEEKRDKFPDHVSAGFPLRDRRF